MSYKHPFVVIQGCIVGNLIKYVGEKEKQVRINKEWIQRNNQLI